MNCWLRWTTNFVMACNVSHKSISMGKSVVNNCSFVFRFCSWNWNQASGYRLFLHELTRQWKEYRMDGQFRRTKFHNQKVRFDLLSWLISFWNFVTYFYMTCNFKPLKLSSWFFLRLYLTWRGFDLVVDNLISHLLTRQLICVTISIAILSSKF
jgi:hypothetical protein